MSKLTLSMWHWARIGSMQEQHCMNEAVPGIGKLQVLCPVVEQAVSACSILPSALSASCKAAKVSSAGKKVSLRHHWSSFLNLNEHISQ